MSLTFAMSWLVSLICPVKQERDLFAYFDGERNRLIDPLVAWRQLWHHSDIDFATEAKISAAAQANSAAHSADEVRDAEERIRKVVREVFGVREWSATTSGLTVIETDQLLSQFFQFMARRKKRLEQKKKSRVGVSQAA